MSRLSGRLCRLCLSHKTYAQAQHHITRTGSAVNSVAGVGASAPVRWKSNTAGGGDDKNKKISSVVQPVDVRPFNNPDDISVGAELTGELKKDDLLKLLNKFYRRPEVKQLAAETGLDNRLFHQAYVGFRRFCVESEALPVDLHIVFSDILQDAGHVDDVFPYFLRHAKEMFPHLDCMDDLRKISDLRLPANWYPEARSIPRKIIYHAGPTNSGKTHHALQRFLTAKSGVYCGPLRLLANEVFHKANAAGTPCDLVTGEERRFVGEDGEPSDHVSCTVEMTSVTTPYEVAVIDEIQMVRDQQRGWAWTRTLLGVCAEEVHICGEPSGIDLVKELLYVTGDTLEVRKYKRLTSLTVLDHAVERFEHVKPGDCIVCFSKNDIYHVSRQLEMRGHQCAVIYGTLPPGTKVAQAQKFNDPDSSCKIMVSTDAIGMGLNLNIKRIIFYSLMKPTMNEKGEMEIDVIPVPMALQIAGRAGRYGTQFEEGEVTTFRGADLPMLKKLLHSKVEPIEQAGLHPTAEQIELFAYHLPKATLSNLIDIFVTLSQLDNSLYFMCNVDDFKYLADMIEHISLPLRTRYVFCCAPISKKHPFTCSVFLKFARQFSRGEPLTQEWLCRQLSWPFQAPRTIEDLVHLEGVFDVLDLYLWLSYRFQDMFPHPDDVREMQKELDEIIQLGVYNITKLLRSQDAKQPIPLEEEEPRGEEVGGEKSLYATLSQDQEAGLPQRPVSLLEQFQNARKKMNTSAYDSRLKKDDTGFRMQRGKKLMDQLVDQGILTQEMLQKLQKELHESDNNNNNGNNRGKSPKHRGRR